MNVRKTFAAVAVAGAIALSGLACGGTGVTELEDRMLFFNERENPNDTRSREQQVVSGCRIFTNLYNSLRTGGLSPEDIALQTGMPVEKRNELIAGCTEYRNQHE